MLITVTPPYDPASLHPQIPPPAILPKPGKDNLRLQRLLKKEAKKPPLSSQQAKLFQSSLSPVSEASQDLERSARSSPLKTPETTHITIQLPPRFSIKPITHHHVSSPFPKAKPFTFKVTEQRRISEHLKLMVSPAASPVHRQGILDSPWQPKGMTKPDMPTQLPPPQTSGVFIFLDPPVSIIEASVEVTPVTKVHVHGVRAPSAKTPLSDQTSTALSNEDRQPSAVHTGKSHTEPPSGQAPVTLNVNKDGAAISKSKAPMPAIPKKPVRVGCLSPTTPEAPVEVTHSTIVHAPSAKTPPSDQAPTVLSNEERMASVTQSEVSHSEPPLGQTPVTLNSDKAGAATSKSKDPMLPTMTAEPSYKTLKSSTPRPVTPGSDTAKSRTEGVSDFPEPHSKSLRPSTSHTAQKQDALVPADSTKAFSTEAKEELVIPPQQPPTIPRASPSPKVEHPLPSVDKARPLTAKLSGWSRLKKHLIVEPEMPPFPETEPAKSEQEEAGSKAEDSQGNTSQDNRLIKSRATKMWDAILYHMTSIKRRKQQEEEKGIRKEEGFSFWCRLPLLHRPRFDARKLKELAFKPMTKITTMVELSLLHRKTPEEPKNFNRTASGWQLK
ncbi:proline-rich protein 33 [Emydura macquarii macquarii]|uniref:proline-rich protein 33 n=1 Tax=Emydura macquarii macquarii TaxID=1129001 RepID=UPI00352A1312